MAPERTLRPHTPGPSHRFVCTSPYAPIGAAKGRRRTCAKGRTLRGPAGFHWSATGCTSMWTARRGAPTMISMCPDGSSGPMADHGRSARLRDTRHTDEPSSATLLNGSTSLWGRRATSKRYGVRTEVGLWLNPPRTSRQLRAHKDGHEEMGSHAPHSPECRALLATRGNPPQRRNV